MPKLRPPKKLEEDVTQLPPEALRLVDVPAKDEPSTTAVDIDVEQPEIEAQPVPQKEPEEDKTTVLQRQLDELRKAEENYKRQVADAERRQAEAQRRMEEREREVVKYRGESEQAQYDSILNAIGASQAEADAAKKDLKSAYAEANHDMAAEAQERLSRALSRLVNLEDGKTAFEARREEAKSAPTSKTNGHTALTDDDRIDAMQGLLPQERRWLKEHKDALNDSEKQAELNLAYHRSVRRGIERGSASYFQFLDEQLGYRTPAQEPTQEPKREPEPQRSVPVAAPVSRETASVSTGKPSNTRVTLTPAMREIARISGITETEYAKQLIELQKAKAEGRHRD